MATRRSSHLKVTKYMFLKVCYKVLCYLNIAIAVNSTRGKTLWGLNTIGKGTVQCFNYSNESEARLLALWYKTVVIRNQYVNLSR